MKPRLHACLLVICSLVATVAAPGHSAAPRFEDAFVFTFIDAPYEQEFGGPPFDRSLYAKVVRSGPRVS